MKKSEEIKDLAEDVARLKQHDKLDYENYLNLKFLNQSKRAQGLMIHDVIEAILEHLGVEAVISPKKVVLKKDKRRGE